MADEPDPKDPAKGDEDDPTPDPDFKAEAEKWKALARKHEATAKKNADAAERLADLEEKDKTELQKLTDRAAAAEKAQADAELTALRYEVAASKGIPIGQAKRLIGSTKEELESDADEYLESQKPDTGDKKDPPPDGKPKPDLKGGGDPEDTDGDFDPDEVLKKIPR